MSAHHQSIEDPTPQVRIEIVDRLPEGRLVARAEAPHETVFLVLKGAERDFPAFLSQLAGVMNEAVESLTWSRVLSALSGAQQPLTTGG